MKLDQVFTILALLTPIVGIILTILGIYYSLKKKIKTVVFFLVVSLLFELIRLFCVFGTWNSNDELSTILLIKSLIGMNTATAEAVVIIIGLIYILSGKFLRKSKIIISSILVITLAIATLHWIGTFEWFNLINCTKTQYIKALKKKLQCPIHHPTK